MSCRIRAIFFHDLLVLDYERQCQSTTTQVARAANFSLKDLDRLKLEIALNIAVELYYMTIINKLGSVIAGREAQDTGAVAVWLM